MNSYPLWGIWLRLQIVREVVPGQFEGPTLKVTETERQAQQICMDLNTLEKREGYDK